MQEREAVVDGVPVRWSEAGEGTTPVVLLHGIPTSRELWRHVVPYLDGVRVLSFELVGYGASIPAGRDRDLSLAAQAGYLDRWLDHLSVERAVLVGHDLGGGVAQIAAVRRPDRCAGILLTNAVSYDSWPIPLVRAMQAVPGLAARTPGPVMKAMLGSLFARGHDDAAMARESLEVHVRHYLEHDGAAAMARQVAALDNADTLAVASGLPTLGVPARVVWGVADQFQPATYGERLARDLGTRPIAIRGGKHFTPEDHPDVIAATVRDLVAEVAA
jgi:pimeloyl-ACP methyl ester carboxylesterase